MQRSDGGRWSVLGGLVLGVLSAGCGERAPSEPEPGARQEQAPSAVAAGPGAGSARVRDVRELRERLAPRLSRSVAGLPVQPGSRGGRRIALQGRLSSMQVVEKRADGTYQVDCLTSERQLDARLLRAEAEQ